MKRRLPDYPQLILIALILITSIALVFAASTSTVAFGVYNPSWNGASNLRSEASAVGISDEIVRSTDTYATTPANGTLAVILSPKTGYDPVETHRIQQFVRNGGTLLVAEDFGTHSNKLLTAIGAQAHIDGRPLRDERHYYRSPAFPLASNVSDDWITSNIDRLTLNHGTVVQPNNSTVLVSSSDYAYLDKNQNDALDPSESLKSRPVATVESYGDGRIVVVSDPSIFINTMLDRSGNKAFTRTLLRNHDRLLLDYSHAKKLPPLSAALLTLKDSSRFQFALGSLGVIVIGVLTYDRQWFKRVRERWFTQKSVVTTADTRDLTALVRERHPDWDDARTERVVQAIKTRRRES